MKILRICLTVLGWGAGALGAADAAQAAELIPIERFAELPFLQGPELSPDGAKLLARVLIDNKATLGVVDIATGKISALPMGDRQELSWYQWAGNNRALLGVEVTSGSGDDEIKASRLLRYDMETKSVIFLGIKSEGRDGDDVIYVDPAGEWLLLSVSRSIFDWPSVYRINIATGEFKEEVSSRDGVVAWFADKSGLVRAGIGIGMKRWFIVYRRTASESFRITGRAKYDDEEEGVRLLRFLYGSDEGYVLSRKPLGRTALYKYNFARNELGELVFSAPENDIDNAWLTEDGTNLAAATYSDAQPRIAWFEPAMKQHQQEIDAALNGRMNRIVSRSRDDKRMIVWTGASNDPGRYYLYVPEVGAMKRLATLHEGLPRSALATTRFVKYKARDGLEIPAFLTLPKDVPAKALPLIIMPHGGPFGVRDTLGWDAEVQLLANRGYAVLQPNYRGSGGYGKAFEEKGDGEIGRRMQDDLDDGMDWLVSDGTVDRRRVCVMGASYGGYAALWAATRNPDRYRCAISFAGVTDWDRMLRYDVNFLNPGGRRELRTKIRGANSFDLEAVSPLAQIEKLQVPVLVAHGELDRNVPHKHARLYAAALSRRAKTHEYYSYPEEGHGFDKTGNHLKFMRSVESFLRKYNPSDLLKSP